MANGSDINVPTENPRNVVWKIQYKREVGMLNKYIFL